MQPERPPFPVQVVLKDDTVHDFEHCSDIGVGEKAVLLAGGNRRMLAVFPLDEVKTIIARANDVPPPVIAQPVLVFPGQPERPTITH
jgi:hypothetical protein